jgi:D-sedoheptulose 7-phosphate isomerase
MNDEMALTLIRQSLLESCAVKQRILADSGIMAEAATCGAIWVSALASGNKVLFVGNGGSAADAQHLAAELMGRFKVERRPLPALALTTDTSALTAIGNDYGYEEVFRRQVIAWARPGDVLVALSTSGNSPNVIAAAEMARELGAKVVGFTGQSGGQLRAVSDACLCVPSTDTAHIQEAHIALGHILCGLVDHHWATVSATFAA